MMCSTCGCAGGEVRLDVRAGHGRDHHQHARSHADAQGPGHPEDHHHHGPDGSLHYGHGPAGNAVPGQSQARLVEIEMDVLARNNALAAANRARLAARRKARTGFMGRWPRGSPRWWRARRRRSGRSP